MVKPVVLDPWVTWVRMRVTDRSHRIKPPTRAHGLRFYPVSAVFDQPLFYFLFWTFHSLFCLTPPLNLLSLSNSVTKYMFLCIFAKKDLCFFLKNGNISLWG